MAYQSTRRGHAPGSRRKKRVKGILPAIGFFAIVGLACFVFLRIALSFSGKVVMLAREAHRHRQEIAALRRETEWLREQNALLRQEAHRLNTRSGIVLEARKQGFGFPGERLLVIEPSPTQPAEKP